MPVFALDDNLIFPHPVLHEPDGLLAVGGDLSPQKLLLAYRWGIFPWYHEGQPLLWWWVTPRLMLRPGQAHISHSLRQTLHRGEFTVTLNHDFEKVMRRCSEVSRKGQEGTWITPDMIEAYVELFHTGHALSVEVWDKTEMVGGLYGVVYGRIFTGESMYAEKSNASKVGFVYLAQYLHQHGFEWIDCQQDTPHMRSLGGKLIGEEEYLEILRRNHLYIIRNASQNAG